MNNLFDPYKNEMSRNPEKEIPKCPHCGNDDPKMIEKLPFYKWDVMKDKYLYYICFVCSKEF